MTMSKGNGGIIRVPNYQQFTIIPHNILTDKRLSMKTRGLLVTMLGLPPEWDYSVMGLTKILPDGKKAIGNAIKELEEFGYLVREQERSEGGKFMGYVYTVIPIPEIPFTQKGDTVKSPENKGVSPFTPFRSTEKRSTDFGTQYNINKYNINKYNDDGGSGGGAVGLTDGNTNLHEEIQQQIEYKNITSDPFTKSLVDNIVDVMVTAYNNLSDKVTFGELTYTHDEIKSLLEQVTSSDVLYTVSVLKKRKKEIAHPFKFTLLVLLQAKQTQATYYNQLVNSEEV